jgi:hypothetical protein
LSALLYRKAKFRLWNSKKGLNVSDAILSGFWIVEQICDMNISIVAIFIQIGVKGDNM